MLSQNIKALRIEKGISQASLGLQIGLTQQAIARWEKGETEPDSDMLNKLANIFDVSVDFLLGRTDERQNNNISNTENDWPPEAKVLFREVKKLTPEQIELVTKLVKEFVNED
jgi:transcriptional regulator with XRE-family HTH domain